MLDATANTVRQPSGYLAGDQPGPHLLPAAPDTGGDLKLIHRNDKLHSAVPSAGNRTPPGLLAPEKVKARRLPITRAIQVWTTEIAYTRLSSILRIDDRTVGAAGKPGEVQIGRD